ncbi:MAG: NAD(+) synthase [Eubacteriales bacterium]|nr:NAD(+) synthase [Eubacteriales bacterium]MDD4389581.1 NAD(+) synthase [Eubacteriales bacterium]
MINSEIIRIATATPNIRVANTQYNEDRIKEMLLEAESKNCGIVLFPELSITGCTASDLFLQRMLYDSQLEALRRIALQTRDLKIIVILGFYLALGNKLYSCSAVIQSGKIRGIVPKMFVSNDNESNDARWFSPGYDMSQDTVFVSLFGDEIPIGNIIFKDDASGLAFAIEVGEALAAPSCPSSFPALHGAHIIFNPTASMAATGKAAYRKDLISTQSERLLCGYVSTSAGVSESTTDVVYSGHQIIAAAGNILAEADMLGRGSNITIAEIDYGALKFRRMQRHSSLTFCSSYPALPEIFEVALSPLNVFDIESDSFTVSHPKNPFIPKSRKISDERCREIFSIQINALARRMEHIGIKKTIVGVSGGLDSTLALLVISEAHKLLGLPPRNIITVTLPGFGTTGKTYNNAVDMIKLLKTDFREISIVESVRKHFFDIGHDENLQDLTYENAQARERTQILMDMAGKEGALLVGTGDLSEIALGWCTYNGDHMSMYGVNCGIPKTLLMSIIDWISENKLSGVNEDKVFSCDNASLKRILNSILDTPISPELLPPDESGDIIQKTEDNVGPYILHDFFLYHTLRSGMPPAKLFFMATQVFKGDYTKEFLFKCLKIFYKRFFSQQFKRSCMPDGPKVTDISLSPRGAFAMPSDADAGIWVKEVERLEKQI